MSIPADPTVTSLITDALRHAGVPTPTTGQVTEFMNEGFQTVKTDLWLACTRDKLLETTVMVILPVGSGQIDTPADFDHEILLDVFSCAASMAFTATAGAATTMTAPATFSADISSIRGVYLFTTGGTGLGQYRQITNYDDTTKVLTITPAWTVNPGATTTAFIGHLRRRLVLDDPTGWASSLRYPNQGYPARYKLVGSSPLNTDTPAIEISPVPDTANYALLLTYGPNITRLDEAGSLFVKHIRERRSLWAQGAVTQAMRRYDEERYPSEYSLWQLALQRYGGHNPTYDRAEAER
jgi:hypothetical protein